MSAALLDAGGDIAERIHRSSLGSKETAAQMAKANADLLSLHTTLGTTLARGFCSHAGSLKTRSVENGKPSKQQRSYHFVTSQSTLAWFSENSAEKFDADVIGEISLADAAGISVEAVGKAGATFRLSAAGASMDLHAESQAEADSWRLVLLQNAAEAQHGNSSPAAPEQTASSPSGMSDRERMLISGMGAPMTESTATGSSDGFILRMESRGVPQADGASGDLLAKWSRPQRL